jgi:S1-C subfamily serine protease
MESGNLQLRFLSASACTLCIVLAACSTLGRGSNAAVEYRVPQVVAPPDPIPAELQPYEPRFEEILVYRGFRVGPTTDPHALHLKLEYDGKPGEVAVTASLIQDGQAVVTGSAVPNAAAAWHWFSDKDAVVQRLANDAINQFDDQLGTYTQHVQIVKAPDALTAAPPAGGQFNEFGTAFAVNAPDTFLTARHVVAGATAIELRCGDGRTGPATVEHNDAGNDLAVLHSSVKAGAFLELAPEDSPALGDHVFTVGFPVWDILGTDPKYTEGVVSSLSGLGDSRNLLQITVPIQPGNSGGPLVDSHGRVVGVIDSSAAVPYFYSRTGTVPQNVNYAVSSYYARPLVKDVLPAAAAALAKLSAIQRTTASVCFVAAAKGDSHYL